MKILLVHPGFSCKRHFNHYEAIIKLIDSVNPVECHLLSCNKTYLACNFRGRSVSRSIHSSIPSFWHEKCLDCQNQLRNEVHSFCDRVINLSDYIYKNIDYFDNLINQLPKKMPINDFISIHANNVNIGKDIWQSIKYNLLMGTPDVITIPPKLTVGYEFIMSGLLQFEGCLNLLTENAYDLLFMNEICYIDWGIPAKVALSLKIPVVRQGNYYLGKQQLTLKYYQHLSEISRYHPLLPSLREVQKIIKLDSIEKYSEKGRNSLIKWNDKSDKKKSQQHNNLIKDWINPHRKTVIFFAHLCYDASMAYGERLFLTNEEWVSHTFEIASEIDSVDWIFRLHPGETPNNRNQYYNTSILLKNLMQKFNVSHIKIMDSSIKIKIIDLIPYIHVGVTLLGSVFFELPSYGVPCINAAKGDNIDIGFTMNPSTFIEYQTLLKNISDIKPLSKFQIMLAQAYAGLVFDEDRFLDVKPVFNTEDSSDEIIDYLKLNRWIHNNKNKAYISNQLFHEDNEL